MVSGVDLFLGLFNNLAIFIILVAVYGILHGRLAESPPMIRQLTMGLCFGMFTIGCMFVKIPVAEGVIVDQRNAVIVLSGVFGGPVSALVCATMAGAYRSYLGGAGVFGGVVGVTLSAVGGMALHRFRPRINSIFKASIAGVAVTVFLIPGFLFVGTWTEGWSLLKAMSIPYGSAIFTGILFVGLLLDQAERRVASQRDLVRSEKRFRSLFESLIDIAYRTDDQGRIEVISPSLKKMTGWDPEKVVGHPITEYYRYPEVRNELLAALMKDGKVENFEAEIRKGDGQFMWVSTTARTFKNADGSLAGVEGVTRDISRLKAAEAEKQKLEESLRHGQKMEAIGTLAGGIAHDFNNILGAIIGYTELVADDLPSDSQDKKYLESVLSAAERAKELTRHILMFSRKGKPNKQQIRIHAVVDEAVILLKQTIPATVALQSHLDPDTGSVMADETQIHQIVMNLCTNAFHAIEDETGEISIELKSVFLDHTAASTLPHVEEGQFAMLTIKDTGKGMDPVTLTRIFEPFFTTKAPGKGTGMGLSVVHGIVRDHDGAIGVESELGKGTTFRVYLPIFEGEHHDTSDENTPLTTGTERILVVDDEPALTELTLTVLEQAGYRARATTSPKEALSLFAAEADAYDLIITDQTMPAMPGVALAKEAMRIRPGIPVIVCTGHSAVLDAVKAHAVGVRALLMKPVPSRKLLETVREVLDESV